MVFPLVPVVATAVVGGLGYLIFADDKKPAAAVPKSGPGSVPLIEEKIPPFVPGVQVTPNFVPPVVEPKPTPNLGLPKPQLPPVVPPIPGEPPGPPFIPNVVVAPPAPTPGVLPPAPGPIAPAQDTAVVITKDFGPAGELSIRSAPNTSATRLGSVGKGTRVKVLNAAGGPTSPGAPKGWMQIQSPSGISGFSSAEFLQLDSKPSVEILPSIPEIPGVTPTVLRSLVLTATVITKDFGPAGDLKIRSAPNASASVLGVAGKGTTVKVLNPTGGPPTAGAPNGWMQIQGPSGAIGFSSAQFLQLNAAQSMAVSGEIGAEGMGDTAVVTGTPGNNLRSQPTVHSKPMLGIQKGVRVRLAEGRNPSPPTPGAPMGWLKVTSPGGKTGFMSAQFLRIEGASRMSGEGRRRRFVTGAEGFIHNNRGMIKG